MTHVGPSAGLAATTATAPKAGTSFVEWGAVFAGAVVAAALSFVFLAFAGAIGLSLTSPWPNAGTSGRFVGSVVVFFVFAQQIGAFVAGGYVAGRMRSRWGEVNEDEVNFRDGLHGGLVWALGIAIGAALLFSTAGATARTAANLAGPAAGAATNQVLDMAIDTLMRPATAQAAPVNAGASPAPETSSPRGEIGRLLAYSVAQGSMSAPNRTYLAQVIAQRTGLTQQDAERRVDEAVTQLRDAADKARRASMLAAFVTAASLLISFAAAWWAAGKGGNHRDNNIAARFSFTPQTKRSPLPR